MEQLFGVLFGEATENRARVQRTGRVLRAWASGSLMRSCVTSKPAVAAVIAEQPVPYPPRARQSRGDMENDEQFGVRPLSGPTRSFNEREPLTNADSIDQAQQKPPFLRITSLPYPRLPGLSP